MGPLGIPEMIVIGILALLIFGPRKLPELGRSVGKALAEFRRASNDIRNTLEEEVRELDRQTREAAHGVETAILGSSDAEGAMPPSPTEPGVPQAPADENPADGKPKSA